MQKNNYIARLVMKFLSFCLFILMVSCSRQDISSQKSTSQFICGRNEDPSYLRPSLYRVQVPNNWIRKDPMVNESIVDTTKSICEFYIEEKDKRIRITIHNFPVEQREQRVPPIAQLTRWKRQIIDLDPTSVVISPQSFGGFVGFLFEGTGRKQDEETIRGKRGSHFL